MLYPSSVPDWNKLRYLTPNEMDIEPKVVVAIEMPEQYAPFFFGAFSSLLEINNWEDFGIIDPETMVDVGNNEVRILDICDAIADCINNNVTVQQSIINQILFNPEFTQSIENVSSTVLINYTTGQSETTQNNGLDYVWNGLVAALPVWQDAVADCFILLNAATDISDAILGLPSFSLPTPFLVTAIQSALAFGITAAETFLKNTSTEEDFLCLIFDQICAAGEPYVLTDQQIINAMEGIGALLPGLPAVGILPGAYFNFSKFKQLWVINTDNTDNNWEVLCSCMPTTCIDVDLELETTFPNPPWQVLTSATFVPNTGVRGTNINTQNAAMSYNATGTVEFTSAYMEYQGGPNPNQDILIQYFDGTNWITVASAAGTTTMRRTLSWSGSVIGTRMRFISEPLGTGNPNWIYEAGVCYVG